MKSRKTIFAATWAAAALVACDNSAVEPIPDVRLTLSHDSVVVSVFQSMSLTAAGGPAQYVSRDRTVATVNANGAITAVATGSTYVVATLVGSPDVRDSVSVRVYADSCSGVRPDFGGPATAEDLDLFSYDISAPLNLQKTFVSESFGVEVSNISFDSPDGGTVTGMMWDPVTRPGRRPAIVLMHGLPGDASSMAPLAQDYAHYGAVVIAIGAPWNRRGAPPYLTFTDKDRFEQIQIVKDLQRAVDVLRSRPNVDNDRIAYVGFSWGGATGALFVGIERRLKTAVLVVGHGGQVSHVTGPVGHKLISNYPCARRVAWMRAMAPIEPIRFVGNANVPLLLQNATMDEYIPNADAEELHAAAQQPKEVRWYESGHGLNQQAKLDALKWLYDTIGLNAPDAQAH